MRVRWGSHGGEDVHVVLGLCRVDIKVSGNLRQYVSQASTTWPPSCMSVYLFTALKNSVQIQTWAYSFKNYSLCTCIRDSYKQMDTSRPTRFEHTRLRKGVHFTLRRVGNYIWLYFINIQHIKSVWNKNCEYWKLLHLMLRSSSVRWAVFLRKQVQFELHERTAYTGRYRPKVNSQRYYPV